MNTHGLASVIYDLSHRHRSSYRYPSSRSAYPYYAASAVTTSQMNTPKSFTSSRSDSPNYTGPYDDDFMESQHDKLLNSDVNSEFDSSEIIKKKFESEEVQILKQKNAVGSLNRKFCWLCLANKRI